MDQNQNQNQSQPFKCTGDCLNCQARDRKTQWQYCASQFTYNSMRMLEKMQNTIEVMQGTVKELEAKIEAIQNSEANVFDPKDYAIESHAINEATQEGVGV